MADVESYYSICLGNLLPWVDTLWEGTARNAEYNEIADRKSRDPPRHASIGSDEGKRRASRDGSDGGGNLTQIIRIIGVFIGIAFAIVSRCSEFEIRYPKLTLPQAETPVGIDSTGVTYAGTREPCVMVCGRSIEGRVCTLGNRRNWWYCNLLWCESKHGACTRYSTANVS